MAPAATAEVTPALLREWALPPPDGGKEGRGRTLVVGGSRETPGAVLLAAEAALRSGAGKLQVATVASAAPGLALALPEALVRGLEETPDGAVAARAADRLAELAAGADSVLVGPGLADVREAGQLLRRLLPHLRAPLVVDALALSAVTEDPTCLSGCDGRVVLTPNPAELGETLGRPDRGDPDPDQLRRDALELAARAGAVVSVGGATAYVAAPDGRSWVDRSGGAGLGVSGSGDVRAGLVAGLLARGADPAQAAVWSAHLHGRAGERLASTVGRVGFLARELPPTVPAVLAEIEQ
jgi:ADP-dependent NAD(P)H-hydrate dehydratase